MSQDNEKDVKERRGGKGESAIGKPVDRWKVWKVNCEDRRDTLLEWNTSNTFVYMALITKMRYWLVIARYYPLLFADYITMLCNQFIIRLLLIQLNNYFIKLFFIPNVYSFYDLRMYRSYFGDLTSYLWLAFFSILFLVCFSLKYSDFYNRHR